MKKIPSFHMRNISSIQLKFVMVFVGMLLIACVTAMVVASAYMQNTLIDDMQARLKETSRSVARLAEETNLSLDEIADMIGSSYYDIHVYDPADPTVPEEFDQSQLSALNEGEIYFVPDRSENLPYAFLKVRDSYLVLSSHTDNNELFYFRNLAFMVLIMCAVIGSVLMLIAVSYITAPVKRLTKATKEVAKGNFNISVEYDAQDEIGQLTQNFNLMTKELRNMEFLRKDFISNVSHEFKTPIASIQGFAQLLKTKDLTTEEFNEYTDIIIDESARLSRLSSNILRLSRLENQSIPSQNTTFSLDEQIRKTIVLLENEWNQKNLELDIELENTNYTGNEEMIQQIWINLLSNAIKFSFYGGLLRVRLKRDGAWIRAEITDFGTGIPQDAQKRIFEKFYQVDPSHSKDGNGLGLAIVKQILDRCGGNISVKSESGMGTTFTVLLPASV
ncbi:MAG: HAMP domain-containing sensor histidine kinase [Christensenella sp.]|nr:HAMP domain-containing sensor histidine kinase [Christensenella sp.]